MQGAKPTLKGAFSGTNPTSSQQQTAGKTKTSKSTGKKCTAHFGCPNKAFYQEQSGTLYCRDHKPRNVPVANIEASSETNKKTAK